MMNTTEHASWTAQSMYFKYGFIQAREISWDYVIGNGMGKNPESEAFWRLVYEMLRVIHHYYKQGR
jgi:hypothetical protein